MLRIGNQIPYDFDFASKISTFCGDVQKYHFDPFNFTKFYAEKTNEGVIENGHHHKK